jgi:HpcH/HpaI aldolase/citrate lyase family
MRLRSVLFVPGDSERKFARARTSGADALILDLEDSVAPSQKAAARKMVAKLVDDTSPRDWSFFVRVNALDTGITLEDLAAIVKPNLNAIMIPKANGAEDLARFGYYLDAFEAKAGMPPGVVKMAVVATETAKAMFALGSYAPAHPRLAALTWGAEDLAAAVGATENKEDAAPGPFPIRSPGRNACSPRQPPKWRRSTRFMRTSVIWSGSNAIAAVRAAMASSDAWRSIPIRSRPSTVVMRPPIPRSLTLAASSRPLPPIPAPERSASTARWSTSRT